MKLVHINNKLSTLIALLLILLHSGVALPIQPNDLRGIGITARDNVTGTNREVKLYRQMHAVIIGIDKYPNLSPDEQLSYAVKDAKGIEDVMREQYSFDNIYTLYNEQATSSGIMGLLQGTLSNIHEDDAVLIFFAGHGTTQKDKLTGGDLGYILPYDGTFNKDKMYINISMSQLRDEVAKVIPAKHVFYVIDACYSGTLFDKRAGGATPEHDYTYLQEVTKERVRQVLTAGTDKQTVLDGGTNGHSVFTGRLIQKLEETEDYITAAELGEYVKRRVHSDAQERNHNQTPVSGAFYGLGDFVFVPNAQKRALEIENERKYLEEELAKLDVQERGELEQKKKALEAKQKIEELRKTKITEAKKREEEQIQKESEARKQSEEKKKQEAERLAYLKTEIEKKRQMRPEASAGDLSIDEVISKIKKLQSQQTEIDVKMSEALKQVEMDYARKIQEADAPRDEFETTADYKIRIAGSEEKKRELSKEQALAEEKVRTQFSSGVKAELDKMLKAEYPVPSNEISFTLGQFDADAGKMQLQAQWTHLKRKDKVSGYMKLEGKDAKLLKEHKDFLKAKAWVRISQSLQAFLLRIEIIDDADNLRSTQVYLGDRLLVPLKKGIMVDTTTGNQWAQDVGGLEMTWDEANAYIRNLWLGGYSDWRLPTKEELESLLNYCKSKRVMLKNGGCSVYFNELGFKNVQSDPYWSSTTYADDPNDAWRIDMGNGSMDYNTKSHNYYVWPIRSGQVVDY